MNLKSKLLLACKSIAFSLLISGCAPSGFDPGSMVANKPTVQVSTGWSLDEHAPYLIHGDSILRLHSSEEEAFNAFPRPRGAYDFFEDPPLDGDSYVAKGWQSGAEGFGIVLVRNRVVLALQTFDNVDADTASQTLQLYEQAMAPTVPEVVPSELASYWFWETGQARLMVCQTTDSKHKNQLVVALGDADVMNALRMSRPAASQDIVEARAKLQSGKE